MPDERQTSGDILVAGFNTPGRVDIISPDGRVVWTYGPASGPGSLDRPSLAVRWPNGMIAVTDDWHHRIVVIDPRTKQIVWEYGHNGIASSADGYLSKPDGLDLLSICMEAGLGLDQGIVRVGQEMRVSHRALSEELLLVNFEQRAGVQRTAAWQGFAERTNVESVRSFVAMLIQTDRFGTPIAKSLNAFSDALRTQRRQKAEEMAAKTTIKLVPPLVFCIFPATGVVTVGPALITVGKNLSHIVK